MYDLKLTEQKIVSLYSNFVLSLTVYSFLVNVSNYAIFIRHIMLAYVGWQSEMTNSTLTFSQTAKKIKSEKHEFQFSMKVWKENLKYIIYNMIGPVPLYN